VAGLGALVADLASGAQGAAVRSGAVTGDVALDRRLGQRTFRGRRILQETYQLAAGIALHGLSLAVASKVVGATALVASGSTRVAAVSTAETTVEAAARSTGTTADTRGRGRAVTRKVTGLAAVVATAVSTVETQRGTIGLNVA
jgi:hypothetical protein